MATRWSSETSNEKSFLLLASAMTTPMMSASGLVIPARKRGVWLRIAARSVLPERGSPEIKWNFRADFATWDAAGMGPLLWFHRDALSRNIPTAHFDYRSLTTRRSEMR